MIRSRAQTKEWDSNFDQIDWGKKTETPEPKIECKRTGYGDELPYLAFCEEYPELETRGSEPWEAIEALELLIKRKFTSEQTK